MIDPYWPELLLVQFRIVIKIDKKYAQDWQELYLGLTIIWLWLTREMIRIDKILD